MKDEVGAEGRGIESSGYRPPRTRSSNGGTGNDIMG